ncbi:MAG: sulfite reductase subunit alpha [Verrucomicrobiales bacterium]|jgi:sulfite reductase (NADPH) flavoprotein alpha-component|nr:sulfite reductase subunit alpha [Verrucomicrobiales bacterium]
MSEAAPVVPYNKNNPFLAAITENRPLSKLGSAKDTRHFVINLAGSGLRYQPGYSLGVFPQNPPALVEQLIARLGLDADAGLAQPDGRTKPLRRVLREDVTLNRVNKKFVRAVAERLPAGRQKEQLLTISGNDEALGDYIYPRDCLDVLDEFPGASFTAAELTASLSRVNPRLYSIASSQAKHPDEAHLTVAVIRYHARGRDKKGLCSGFLADDAPLRVNALPVFLTPNKHFKLPDADTTSVIMVGPGTGIAPFRAFLEERETRGATGRNWLLFGDQHRATDFLYEEEFEAWRRRGLLTRLDTAFSRDQAHKIYVQDRLREHGAELWRWLQDGAYFYVCGDAKRMAKDVHQALLDIARQHGGLAPAAANEYVSQTLMKDERRYARDVY